MEEFLKMTNELKEYFDSGDPKFKTLCEIWQLKYAERNPRYGQTGRCTAGDAYCQLQLKDDDFINKMVVNNFDDEERQKSFIEFNDFIYDQLLQFDYVNFKDIEDAKQEVQNQLVEDPEFIAWYSDYLIKSSQNPDFDQDDVSLEEAIALYVRTR